MSDVDLVLAHLVGDYVVQSDWMANEKTTAWVPAVVHGVTYTFPYVAITRSWRALAVIAGTHAVIDHYRLAKHVSWAKNQIAPSRRRYAWNGGENSGYPASSPPWMSTWLMIITDNTMHLVINRLAVRFL